jgi:hypothetical protein
MTAETVDNRFGGFHGTCFRCGNSGHWAESDTCPWLTKAATRKEHENRIAHFVSRYWNHDITDWQKREYINHENKLFYDGQIPSRIGGKT